MIESGRTGILIAALCMILGCNLSEVAFPVVETGIPIEDAAGRLKVELYGSIQIDEPNDLSVVREYGFAWSADNPLPSPETDQTLPATLDPSDLSLTATLVDSQLNHEQDQYYVRAFIRIIDEHRDAYLVSRDQQRFSFKSKFSIVTGFPSIVQDQLTTISLVESADGFNDLINDHGHLYSTTSGATLESCPTCFVSLGAKPEDPTMFSTSIIGTYNTKYYITPVIDLDGQILYGDEIEATLTGGINKSSNYPFTPGQVDPLYDGIATSAGEFADRGYIGVGNALFEVTAAGETHELIYSRITNYPDELDGIEFRSGTGFVVSDNVCIYPGVNENSQEIEGRVFCYSLSDQTWEIFNPEMDASFIPRFEAISFTIDDRAYIGFGSTGPSTNFYDFLEFCPTCPEGEQMRLFRPPADVRDDLVKKQRGQTAAVIGNSAYITTGKGSEETRLKLIKFTPDGGSGTWEGLNPAFEPAGRSNAISFALNGKVYVGFGQTLEQSSLDVYNDIWIFDPIDNAWHEYEYETPTILERSRGVSFTLDGNGYFGSGQTITLNSLTDMWVLTPNRID